MPRRTVLMIVGDFVEDYEAMVPAQMLSLLGHEVVAVCPGKRPGQTVATAIHDFDGFATYSEKRGHNFSVSGDFASVAPDGSGFDALLIPGGRSPEYLRLNGKVLELTRSFFTAAKPVASICHGQQILTAAGVVSGRHLTAYPALQPDIQAAGGHWVAASPGLDNAHTDGLLVTAPAWPAHPAFMAAFLKLLGSHWQA